MIPSIQTPLIRPAVDHLFGAEEAARAARRLISPAEKANDQTAGDAIARITFAIGELVAARADLAKTFPAAAVGIRS